MPWHNDKRGRIMQVIKLMIKLDELFALTELTIYQRDKAGENSLLIEGFFFIWHKEAINLRSNHW